MAGKLTAKQERFVQEYLIDLNATQAAIRAGYPEKTARSVGGENLTKPAISSAIEAAQKKLAARTEVTQDMVIAGLLEEARNKDEDASHSARVTAWATLGKHLGMFVEKLEIKSATRLVIEEEVIGGDGPPQDTATPNAS